MNPLFQLRAKNANRCLTLVVVEIVVIWGFHRREWSLFLKSELIALGLHLILSIFWLCFYVMMRSRLKVAQTKWYDIKRIIWEPLLYLVFDYLIIHVILGVVMGEFEFHWIEFATIVSLVFVVNLYFDTHKHHCCHDHCW